MKKKTCEAKNKRGTHFSNLDFPSLFLEKETYCFILTTIEGTKENINISF